jgi:hypothetical protein
MTNNYEDLRMYDELLSVWSRYIGHVTNVGGVHEDKKPNQREPYTVVPKATAEAMQWLQTNALHQLG